MHDPIPAPQKTPKDEIQRRELHLRRALPLAQRNLADQRTRAIVLVIAGLDGTGKARLAQHLLTWLDPRTVTTTAIDLADPYDDDRPAMWRYWTALPPKGEISLLLGSWYQRPLLDRISGRIGASKFEANLQSLVAFETMLAHEGVLVSKLWLHLPDKVHKKRLKAADDADPKTDVHLREWRGLSKKDRACRDAAVKIMLQATSTPAAPWTTVSALHGRDRDTESGRVLLEALSRPASTAPPDDAGGVLPMPSVRAVAPEVALDLEQRSDPETYKKHLPRLQHRLLRLSQGRAFRERGVVAVFEGPDAAGKGGCIRRTVHALDPRLYRVHAIAAPSDEDLAHPYLWRFWRRVPPRGTFGVFDRSWYGRVLVERVEGLCAEADWARAYREIAAFESELVESGLIVVKFWLQISKAEQLCRFEDRQNNEFKRFKITSEDWRNRAKWDAYQRAAADMVAQTSTESAPWTLVAAEDKRHARLQVLETLCQRLSAVHAPRP